MVVFAVALGQVGPEVLAYFPEYPDGYSIMLPVSTFRRYLVTKTR